MSIVVDDDNKNVTIHISIKDVEFDESTSPWIEELKDLAIQYGDAEITIKGIPDTIVWKKYGE